MNTLTALSPAINLPSKNIRQPLRHTQHRHMPTLQPHTPHHPLRRRKHPLLRIRQYTLIQFAQQVAGRNVSPRRVLERCRKRRKVRVSGVRCPMRGRFGGGVVVEGVDRIIGNEFAAL